MGKDSSERQGLSEALHRQSALLERVQRIAHIGGWELNWHSKTLTWTSETYRIHGVSRADYTPTLDSAIGFYAPRHQPLIRRALRSVAEEGARYDLELQIVRRDGARRWVRAVGEKAPDEPGLICGVFQDITDRRHLEQEIVKVGHRERTLMGFDVHDGLGQELAGVSLLLGGVIAGLPAHSWELRDELRKIEALVHDSIGTCRELAHGWSPTQRARSGLVGAVHRLAARIEKHHGVKIRVRTRGRASALDDAIADHFFRITQEAITNAIKHGNAQHISVALASNETITFVSVRDDGAGLRETLHPGMGLKIMHYRARLMGASLTVETRPRGGVRVRCCLVKHDFAASPS